MISKIFRKAKLLRMLLAAWRLEEPIERLRLHYDLVIETQISVPFRRADASYVHFSACRHSEVLFGASVQVAPL